MKTTKLALVITVLILAVGAPVALTAASAADETAIREVANGFVDAWNKHDPAAMAATWAADGDLINPAGRVAKGRAAIQQLLAEEHGTVMKASTFKIVEFDLRMLAPAVALADWTVEITGLMDPAGNPVPDVENHVVVVFVKNGGRWQAAAARPYSFESPPPGR